MYPEIPRIRWQRAARLRRFLMGFLILCTTLIASSYMADVLPGLGSTRLELAIVIVFGALFAWVSIGFWEAVGGLFTLWRRRDPLAISAAAGAGLSLAGTDFRTAIVMPICDEEVDRVFAGLRATYRSLEGTGQIEHFDFFVLSDTGDPDIWVEEEIAWADLCRCDGRIQPDLLSAPDEQLQTQEREHRRLLHALGPQTTGTWSFWMPTV